MKQPSKSRKPHEKRAPGNFLKPRQVKWIELMMGDKGWGEKEFVEAYKKANSGRLLAKYLERQFQRIFKGDNRLTPLVEANLARTFGMTIEEFDAKLRDLAMPPSHPTTELRTESQHAPLFLQDIKASDEKRRRNLLEEWKQVKAIYPELPAGRATKTARQQELQKAHPIDFTSINRLLEFLQLKEWSLKIPVKDEAYQELKRAKDRVCEAIHTRVGKLFETHKTSRLRSLLDAVYNYLAEEDRIEQAVDFAFVPGYRATFRADKAAELFLENKCKRIFLSGSIPYYEKANHKTIIPLTEACALAIYLVDERYKPAIDWPDLVVEERPRDTQENVQFSVKFLNTLRSETKRPATLVIVSSPYHLRRTYLEWMHFRDEHPELVGDVKRVACSAKYIKGNWFKHLDGVKAYVGDFWKLHGGRVIGQF
jgi:hypothetical protein